MAKINNAQVIQKLIDELQLYPGTDLIPTELAEKILPVFQINDQAIIFSESGTPRYITSIVAGNATNTLTVPKNLKWRLDLLTFQFVTNATVTSRVPRVQIRDDSGNLIMEASNTTGVARVLQNASLDHTYVVGNVDINLDNPIWSRDLNSAAITLNFKLPVDKLILPEGWTINVLASNGVAGDTITTRMQVLESKDNFTT